MKNFIIKNKGILIFAVIALAILTVVYIWGGSRTSENGVIHYQTEPLETNENICRISISCDDILANMSTLNPDKAELIPDDGIILASTDMTFTDGETVFDVLKRTAQVNNIHLDFSMTPGAYIKGIGNIYEQDCGSMSGWGFYLNGESPTVGCSDIQVKSGDVIEFTYTCDFSKLYQ